MPASGAGARSCRRSRAGEFDIYGGIRPTIGPVAFDFGFMYYYYPRETTLFFADPASTTVSPTNFGFGQFTVRDTDMWEVYGKATWTATDWLAIGGFVYYTPNWLGSGARAPTRAATRRSRCRPPGSRQTGACIVSGEAARYWIGTFTAFGAPFDLPDYTHWNLGLAVTYKVFTFDVRYYDTDLSRNQCFLLTSDPSGVATGTSKWCDATVIAKLSFDMTLNNNIK